MTKKRPVVVLQKRVRGYCTATLLVVPLSTAPPNLVLSWHLRIPAGRYSFLSGLDVFIKGDMAGAVPLAALDRVRVNGAWIAPILPREEFARVQTAVREAMAL